MAVLPLVVLLLVVILWKLYSSLLPHPLPNIPYNSEAVTRILGDVPRLRKEAPDNPQSWMIEQATRSGSPIFQVFVRPFSKPLVVLTDFWEAQDIMMRRRDFDRAGTTRDILGGESRTFHIGLQSNEEWKAHRDLLRDLMTPSFLHSVAAPTIYQSARRLLRLWSIKASIADGLAFAAEQDIFYTALDAVLDFGFGEDAEHRALVPQIELFESAKSDTRSSQRPQEVNGTAITFPSAPINPALVGIIGSAEAIEGVIASGFPRIFWWWQGRKPRVRARRSLVDSFVRDQVDSSAARLKRYGAGSKVNSAVDFMLQRETAIAKQADRQPVYWSETIRDEALGFLVAGHDTTSTTLCWVVKFLADHQKCQTRLREELQAAHQSAIAEDRLPTHTEIATINIPYLEAVMEEILRLAHTAPAQEREALEDTVVLGRHIPKGVVVMMGNQGPSFTKPAHFVDDSLRSESSRKVGRGGGVPAWDSDDMDRFVPERWLAWQSDEGIELFNAQSGPTLPFGLGKRGCFGRRLAYLEMRLILTLLIWSFELQQCPESLSGYASCQGLTRKPRQCYVRLKPLGHV